MKISNTPESFSDLLKRSLRMEVPVYQREYSWEIDEVSEMFYDINNCSNEEEYFLGTIILSKKENYEIIDGQQRLITMSLMLRILLDNINEYNESKEINEMIKTDYWDSSLFQIDPKEILPIGDIKKEIPKIKASRRDDDLYRNIILGTYEKPSIKYKSHKRLNNAYGFLVNRIEDLKNKNGIEGIVGFSKKVLYQCSFVILEVGSDAEAFVMFKTFNSKGLELSKSDLLKNQICIEAEKKDTNISVEDAISKWEKVRDNLLKVNIDVYLFHHINSIENINEVRVDFESKNGVQINGEFPPIPKKYLFKTYEYLLEIQKVEKFLANIHISSNDYALISSPPHKSDYKYLRGLKELNASRCYPLLLFAKEKLDENQFKKLTKAIEILTFRHSTILQKDAKVLESFYYKLKKYIRKGNLGEIYIKIKQQNSIEDDYLVSGNLQKIIFKKNVSKYILCRISEKRGDILYDWKDRQIHREHIMPETPKGEFKKMREIDQDSKDSYEEHLNYLGNLTLLKNKENIKLSNEDYIVKKEGYKKSDIKITKEIQEKWEEWNYERIEERQELLIKDILKIWSKAEVGKK